RHRPTCRRLSRAAGDFGAYGRRHRRAARRDRTADERTKGMSDGLEGVVAAKTVLSHADGERGDVWVRGRPIAELVAKHGYEGTVALMWDGFAGDGLTRETIVQQLGDGRVRAFARLGEWLPAAARRPPIEGLRLALAALADDSAPAAIAA